MFGAYDGMELLRVTIDFAVVGVVLLLLLRRERSPDLAAAEASYCRFEVLRDDLRLLIAQAEGQANELDGRLARHGERMAGLLASLGERLSRVEGDPALSWQPGLGSVAAPRRDAPRLEPGAEEPAPLSPAEIELQRGLDRARQTSAGSRQILPDGVSMVVDGRTKPLASPGTAFARSWSGDPEVRP